MTADFHLPLERLLPLRGVLLELRFITPACFRLPLHYGAVGGFIAGLLDGHPQSPGLFLTDPVERGHRLYETGEFYRVGLLTNGSSEGHLHQALDHLRTNKLIRLGGGEVELVGIRDYFSQAPIEELSEMSIYDLSNLEAECRQLKMRSGLRLRFHHPLRIYLAREQKLQRKGDGRFCQNAASVAPGLLLARLWDSLNDLLMQTGSQRIPRPQDPVTDWEARQLFWVQQDYRDEGGHATPLGGLMGTVQPPAAWLEQEAFLAPLVLGQYLGIGHRRTSGLGRYRLEDSDGWSPVRHPGGARTILSATLEDAPFPPETLGQLRRGQYAVPPMHCRKIPKPDGGQRILSIAPLPDRAIQRHTARVLSKMLDPLFREASTAYRPGRSRHLAEQIIKSARDQQAIHVLESDVESFFDKLPWAVVENRLRSLLGPTEPLVDLILRWIGAPLMVEGSEQSRQYGLPQGSPFSPLLSNLILDDFDGAMERDGYRLVRYADDFLVLAEAQKELQPAQARAEKSLDEVGLKLKRNKMGIKRFQDGFR